MFFDEFFTIFGFRIPDLDFFVLPFIALGIMYAITRHLTTMIKGWHEIYQRGRTKMLYGEKGYLGDMIQGALGILTCLIGLILAVPAFFWGIAGRFAR